MDAARSILLSVPCMVGSRNFIRLHVSRFPFQNIRLDRRVKRARLVQSGVADIIDVVPGNEHRLSRFGHFISNVISNS